MMPTSRRVQGAQDDINHEILHALGQHGRSTMRELAGAVGRTERMVRDRVAALEMRGVVTGYEACIDWAQMGFPLTAVVEGFCPPGRSGELAGQLQRIPNLVHAVLTTGSPNVLATVRARDMQDVRRTLASLSGSVMVNVEARITVERLVAHRQPVPVVRQPIEVATVVHREIALLPHVALLPAALLPPSALLPALLARVPAQGWLAVTDEVAAHA